MFDFPNNPILNDQYTPSSGGITFVWNGYAWIMKDGPWGSYGITLLQPGSGITLTPNPITGSGTVSLTVPVSVALGGTGATDAPSARTSLGAVNIAGDTMTGELSITMATPSLRLNKSIGQANNIWGQRVGVNRWVIVPGSNDVETGTGNAGSNFLIGRYTDAGVLIDFPLTIVRASSEVQLPFISLFSGDLGASATNRALLSSNVIRFKQNAGDEINSGAIGYRNFDSTALGIVGVGTTAGSRKVHIWDHLDVNGNISLVAGNNLYLLNNACLAVYDTGNAVARQAVIMGGDNIMYFGDSARYTTIRSGGVIALQGGVNVTGSFTTSGNIGCVEIVQSGSAHYFRNGSWPGGPYVMNDGSNWILKGGGIHAQDSGGGTYGAFNTSGQVCSLGARPIAYNDGSTAIIYRSMDTNWWMYYSSNSTASYHAEVHYFRNWNGSVEFAHIANGDFSTSRVICNRIDIYGGVFYNGYGDNWLYFNGSLRVGDLQSQNNLNASGSLITNGVYWNNWNGWGRCQSSFRSDNDIRANGALDSGAGLVYLNGMYWQNNGGWMYCPWGVRSDGNIQAGNDLNHQGVVRCYGGSGRGARMETMGWEWDWITWFYSANSMYFSPDKSGAMVVHADDWWSDARLKTAIRNSEIDALGLIMATPVRTWEWTERGAKLNTRYAGYRENTIGLVAQELQQTIPIAVKKHAIEEEFMLDWNYVQPYMFRAIQQLAEMNAKLEARIAQLEAR